MKAGTIADTEVLKAIVKRAFLKSAENVADLWVRDDRAFIKIRGFRESFKPGNIFQVKIPARQFREGLEQYFRELLMYVPEPNGSHRGLEEGWRGYVVSIEKDGDVMVMRHFLGGLTSNELESVRDYLLGLVSRIDELLEEERGGGE